jgi:two-component system, response regulator PdtaR
VSTSPTRTESAAFPAKPPSVFVVEDEVLIRMAMGEALRKIGLTAIELRDADEALQVINGGIVPDALFTDIRMPGSIDGLHLAVYLETLFPAMKVFVTSGHVVQGDIRLRLNFISKPFDFDQVARKIKRALMRPS